MNHVDWSNYKFHCSGLSNLMTKSRKKDEELSETTKSYLTEIYIREVWGREKSDMVANKYTQKGIMCETDSIELVEKAKGATFFKNSTQLANDYITGTPDVVKPILIDIKTSWDMFTFAKVDEDQAKKDYYYQLLGYMWLLNMQESYLMYCLVNTPEVLVNDEMQRLAYKLPPEHIKKFVNNYVFDDVPLEMRVKTYKFIYDDSIVQEVKTKVEAARRYLLQISL